ncbi:hypothetical protein J7M00_07975 [bacterium]|nr:hypothetical protein [bacterium]
MYPNLPRKQRETKILEEHYPAIFIIGIGWVLGVPEIFGNAFLFFSFTLKFKSYIV